MAIVRFGDPFRNISTLQERINKVFEDTFSRSMDSDDTLATCDWKPPVDIYEAGGDLVFKVELPGVTKEDVTVEVKDSVLTIKGIRGEECEAGEENFYRRERCCGTFHRSFTMPYTMQPDRVQAKFKDGILEVRVPKPAEERPRRVDVVIE